MQYCSLCSKATVLPDRQRLQGKFANESALVAQCFDNWDLSKGRYPDSSYDELPAVLQKTQVRCMRLHFSCGRRQLRIFPTKPLCLELEVGCSQLPLQCRLKERPMQRKIATI